MVADFLIGLGRPNKLLIVSWVVAVGALCMPVYGQSVPQYIGVTEGIVDEFGELLKGTDPAAYEFGMPVTEGALVQILKTLNGSIDVPGVNGLPINLNNTVLYSTRIGIGALPDMSLSGIFGAAVVSRPPASTEIFVRIFNAPYLEDSSFYGNSQVYTVSNSGDNAPFVPLIEATDQPLDVNDDDSDGLNNSWEKSYGSNPLEPDTDGDGVSDGTEIATGTDLLDDESLLIVADISCTPNQNIVLLWLAIEGTSYDIQCGQPVGYEGQVAYEDVINAVVATQTEMQVTIPADVAPSCGMFRVQISSAE